MKKKPIVNQPLNMIFGTIDNNGIGGIYFILPCDPVSLNDYRKMHFGEISKLKGEYKSMLDVLFYPLIKDNIKSFDDTGLHVKPIFDGRVEIEWIVNHKLSRQRDPSNYTQKILLDAIVMLGIIKDDSSQFVISDRTMIGNSGDNSIICIIWGNLLYEYMLINNEPIDRDTLFYKVGI